MTRLAIALAALVSLAAPAAAEAVPDCGRAPTQRVLASGLGLLESVIVDDRGHLFFTDSEHGQLLRMNRRGAEPKVVVEGIRAPGGLALMPDGSLLVGYGDSLVTASRGTENPQAGLIRFDPSTGETSPYADGLTMANGVTRGPDGAVYASNDFGIGVDRVLDGQIELAWAQLPSSNGLVVDSSGRHLYAAQTFVDAAIARIELTDPPTVSPYFQAPASDRAAGLDGLTRDQHNRLYVAANLGGAVWRVGPDRNACALAHMPPLGPSAVAFGTAPGKSRPSGFGRRNLYVTTFQGELLQLKDVRGRRP
jgi:sugar lactone lactonase YvrE